MNINFAVQKLADDLKPDRKRSIGEVAKELKVETHVIRFWEEHFPQIKPQIGLGKRRYYYNKQISILKKIRQFLYEEGYTVAGLQKLLKKRKHDNHKEEDLDLILSTPSFNKDDESLNSANDQFGNLEKNARRVEIDDFILNSADNGDAINFSDVEINDEIKIDLHSKLFDFSSIKLSAIDPRIRNEIEQLVKNIRGNLQKLKSLK
jgi:DNA-binding transcriptional MerR regulator